MNVCVCVHEGERERERCDVMYGGGEKRMHVGGSGRLGRFLEAPEGGSGVTGRRAGAWAVEKGACRGGQNKQR